jgi:hypothetical protein
MFWDVRVEKLLKKGAKKLDESELVWRPMHVVNLLSLQGKPPPLCGSSQRQLFQYACFSRATCQNPPRDSFGSHLHLDTPNRLASLSEGSALRRDFGICG